MPGDFWIFAHEIHNLVLLLMVRRNAGHGLFAPKVTLIIAAASPRLTSSLDVGKGQSTSFTRRHAATPRPDLADRSTSRSPSSTPPVNN